MAVRPAGSAQQLITWKTAPTLSAKVGDAGVPGGSTAGWHLTNLYIANPLGKQVTIAKHPDYTYPAGFSQGGVRNQVVNWSSAAAAVARTPMRWIATQTGPSHSVTSPEGWVEALAPEVLTPQPPTNVQARAISTTEIEVTWDAPTSGSTASKYHVCRSFTGAAPWEELEPPVDAPTTTYTDDELPVNTRVWYCVETEDANAAVSSQSVVADATTFIGAPAAPVQVTAAGLDADTIRVAWIAASTLPAADHFHLYWSASELGSYAQVGGNIAGTSYDHEPLPADTERWYKVKAIDVSDTESAFSTPPVPGRTLLPAKPAAPVPGVPQVISNTAIKLTWTPGVGEPADTYSVYRSKTGAPGSFTLLSVGGVPASGITLLTYTHTGIQPGTQLWYQIAAVNEQGESLSSTVTASTYVVEIPQAPVNVAAAPDPNDPQHAIRVTWSPASTGPVPEKYEVHHSTSSGGSYTARTTEQPASPYIDAGLNPDTDHFYKIKAIDVVDAVETPSEFSTPPALGHTAPLPLPETPTNFRVESVSGSTSKLDVYWTTSEPKVRIYKSRYQTGPWDPAVEDTASPYQATGLLTNTTYWFYLEAVDGTAVSAPTIAKSGTTEGAPSTGTIVFIETYDTVATGEYKVHNGSIGPQMKAKIDGVYPKIIVAITDAAPQLVAATRYQKTTLIKDGNANFRSEVEMRHGYGGEPTMAAVSYSKVAPWPTNELHYRYPEDLWYGVRIRIDACPDSIGGYYLQWHDNPGGDGRSPPVALLGHKDEIRMRLEKNYDNPSGNFTSASVLSDPLISGTANIVGKTHDYIWRIRWDTRANDQGGSGLIIMYIDDSTTPVWEWHGQTCHPGPGSTQGGWPYVKMGLYKTAYQGQGTAGATNRQSHDHLKIGAGNCTIADVKPPAPRPT